MRKPLKLLGKRFGKLVVKSRLENNKFGGSVWECVCECGETVVTKGAYLSIGHTKSCGCLKVEFGRSKRQRSLKEAKAHEMYLTCSSGASKRDLVFELSKDDVIRISSLPCYHCGSAPKEATYRVGGRNTRKHVGSGLFVNGIDILDNKTGYTLENSVPCCKMCNFMKSKLNVEDFKSHVKKISNHIDSFNFSLIDMCKDELAVNEFVSRAA